LDLAVDGADELDHDLQLTKGGGGALLREKVVASLASRFVVIATADKLVDRLGATFPIPVEVIPFAVVPVRNALAERGFEVRERAAGDRPYVTDNGNRILDATFQGGIVDPAGCDVDLALIPGVADHGLFIDLATEALLGTVSGDVQRLHRPAAG
ncbi:MAG: ribose 5-phosphate isomerase A, partial [Ilumatobacteraceae bacterium]